MMKLGLIVLIRQRSIVTFLQSVINKKSSSSSQSSSSSLSTTYDFNKYIESCYFAYKSTKSNSNKVFALHLYNEDVPNVFGGDDVRNPIDILAFDDSSHQIMINVVFHAFIHNWRTGNCLLTNSSNKKVHHRINLFDRETAQENGIYLF